MQATFDDCFAIRSRWLSFADFHLLALFVRFDFFFKIEIEIL